MNAMQQADDAEATREILRKVRRVEIRSRRMVNDFMIGAYHSVFKGQGMDFEEVREYSPGDEIRSIDWNVTAKMDRPFIKKYREERELTIMLMVDLSASGNFGSTEQSKRELAAELGSVLAFSAAQNNDKVGLILFTDKIEKFIPPQKGHQHILRVIREILFFEPESKGTDIPMALKYLNKVLKRKAISFLLSDFILDEYPDPKRKDLEPESWKNLFKTIMLTNKRHDLISIELIDPRELELPNIGYLTIEDAETGEEITVNTSSNNLRKRFRDENSYRRNALKRAFRKSSVDHLSIRTDQPYINALRTFFQIRGSRR